MSLYWRHTNLEKNYWSIESGPSINPDPPEDFRVQYLPEELQLYIRGKEGIYGGALAKSVVKLPAQNTVMQLSLMVKFGPDLKAYGQVLELDTKFTDSEGYTYPGDYQILVQGWQPQIGNPWFNWGEPLKLQLDSWNPLRVIYDLNYKDKTIRINGSDPIPATQEGWDSGEIVNQLQLCSNSKAGFHTVRYQNIVVGVQ